jgi:branched-chain amino acid transport system substrate-binding protein
MSGHDLFVPTISLIVLVAAWGEIRRMAFACSLLEASAFFWCRRSRWQPAAVVASFVAAMGLAGCSSSALNSRDLSATLGSPPAAPATPDATSPAPGAGDYKVGLVLPFSATGNAGSVALAMRNAAEMALADFRSANIQLLPKDDGGTAQGAQAAVEQVIDDGAQIVLGPLFSHSVSAAKVVARNRGVPMIAFSNDSSVAGPGTYLLSFLPESDVERVVAYAVSQGKRSFIGLAQANAYGSVAEGEFKQSVARRGGRVVAFEHYGDDRNKIADIAKVVAQSANQADALFIPDGETASDAVAALAAAGVNLRQFTILGTQLWDDPRVYSNPQLEGAMFAGPDPAGFRAFSDRYRGRYNQDPPRPAALAYDAVSLINALVKAQPGQRITTEPLTNPSGFASEFNGVFRLRTDGTNQRGLAVLKVTPSGPQIIAPAVRTFSLSAT